MCCFIAIIFFDFGVVVSIHLSCSHITVSGWQCNVGDKNKNSYYELPSVQPDEGFFLSMYYGLKSVSPVPSKQSMSENERFIVIQHKPLLKFAFTGLDQAGEISPRRISSNVPIPTTVNHTEKISLRTDNLKALGLRHGMRVG